MSLNTFLEFWRTAVAGAEDPGKRLSEAFTEAASDLKNTRAETLKFIEPVKNSRGVWLAGFASDKVDEVASLSSTIQEKADKLQSISHDIESFLDVTGDKPDTSAILQTRSGARGAINQASQSAQAVRIAASNRSPRASMQELSSDPQVVEAEERLSDAKAKFEPIIAEFDEKMRSINEILRKYDRN